MDAVILDPEIVPLLELAPDVAALGRRAPGRARPAQRAVPGGAVRRGRAHRPRGQRRPARRRARAPPEGRRRAAARACTRSTAAATSSAPTTMDDARSTGCARIPVRRGLGRVPARAGDAVPRPARGLLRGAALDVRPRRRARHRPRRASASPGSARAAGSPPASRCSRVTAARCRCAFQLLECPMIDDRQTTSSSRLDGLPDLEPRVERVRLAELPRRPLRHRRHPALRGRGARDRPRRASRRRS